MPNSSNDSSGAEEEYWNSVQSDIQYKASKIIGTYILLIIFICGSVGNLLSFAVMIRRTMRSSSTAFYMAALALADTTVLIIGCLRRWVLETFEVDLLNEGPVACHIVNFLQYWSFDVAVWILVVMTIDRAMVVTNPLKAYIYATKKRTAITLVCVMTLCVGKNVHFFFTTTHEDNVCTGKKDFREFYVSIWPWVDAAVYSFLPFMLLLIVNIVIIGFLMSANAKKERMTNHFKVKRREEQRSAVNSRKLSVMLLSVTSAFILLTAPGVVLYILREKGEPFFDLNKSKDMAKYILTRQISRVLLYLNHSVNFFLYCMTGSKFRTELIAMIRCRNSRKDRRRRSLRMSVGSIRTETESVVDLENSESMLHSESSL